MFGQTLMPKNAGTYKAHEKNWRSAISTLDFNDDEIGQNHCAWHSTLWNSLAASSIHDRNSLYSWSLAIKHQNALPNHLPNIFPFRLEHIYHAKPKSTRMQRKKMARFLRLSGFFFDTQNQQHWICKLNNGPRCIGAIQHSLNKYTVHACHATSFFWPGFPINSTPGWLWWLPSISSRWPQWQSSLQRQRFTRSSNLMMPSISKMLGSHMSKSHVRSIRNSRGENCLICIWVLAWGLCPRQIIQKRCDFTSIVDIEGSMARFLPHCACEDLPQPQNVKTGNVLPWWTEVS